MVPMDGREENPFVRILTMTVITLLALLVFWWDRKHPFPIPVIRNHQSGPAAIALR